MTSILNRIPNTWLSLAIAVAGTAAWAQGPVPDPAPVPNRPIEQGEQRATQKEQEIDLGRATTLGARADAEPNSGRLPTVKFFYYDPVTVEWIVSAEQRSFEEHLAANAESQLLYESTSSAVFDSPHPDESASQMSLWIERERGRFEQSRNEATRMRMAEGIVAYLRAHDFSIENLVEALKRRSGASDVELVAVHLRDQQGDSSFKFKVVLVQPDIDMEMQGFNVRLRSPRPGYSAVTYALGVALYEVHEILQRDAAETNSEVDDDQIEPLPLPESLEGPELGPGPIQAFNRY